MTKWQDQVPQSRATTYESGNDDDDDDDDDNINLYNTIVALKESGVRVIFEDAHNGLVELCELDPANCIDLCQTRLESLRPSPR